MERALGFLKDDARHSGSDFARKAPLLAFLSSVGIGIKKISVPSGFRVLEVQMPDAPSRLVLLYALYLRTLYPPWGFAYRHAAVTARAFAAHLAQA